MIKGRSVTAAQKKFHSLLAEVVGCVACRKDGNFNDYISIHHIAGRTRHNAHWLVLPLCASHHMDMGDGVPCVHPYKARFEGRYGKQIELLNECIDFLTAAGFEVPMDALIAANNK